MDNRLASVTTGDGTTSYFYDADGGLVRKAEPCGTTVYGNADYEAFYPVTPTVPATYTHKLYLPVTSGGSSSTGACQGTCTYYRFDGQPVAVRTGGAAYWLHGDHLGSASATTSITGLV